MLTGVTTIRFCFPTKVSSSIVVDIYFHQTVCWYQCTHFHSGLPSSVVPYEIYLIIVIAVFSSTLATLPVRSFTLVLNLFQACGY